MPRSLVVHASDVLAKGFVAVAPGRRAPDGRPTNALSGLVRVVRDALALKVPEHAVAVVDAAPPPTWPAALFAQHERIRPVLEAHGLATVVTPSPVHVVASYVHAALEAGHDVVVVGSDKRLAQLVSHRVWWYDGYKRVRYTPEAVFKRFGVGPEQVADWLALVGDNDACPGVEGIGKKGAVELLERYGSIPAALDDLDAVPGRTGNALRADPEEVRVQHAGATLHRVSIPQPLADLPYSDPNPSRLNALYAELGLFSLLTAEGAPRAAYALCEDEAAVREAIGHLGAHPAALHAVIDDPSPPRGLLVGLAVSGGPGQGFYVPFSAVPPAALRRWLEDADRPKVGHDIKAAVVAFARVGIDLRGIVGDSALASHLADPSGSAPHELGPVAQARLHRPARDDTAIRGKGARRKQWSEVDPSQVGPFACHLADLAGQLWRHLAPAVQRDLLDENLALCATLVRMELAGIPVDRDDLATVGDDFDAMRLELEAGIHALAGRAFNVGSTKQLGDVLYTDLGLPVLSHTKTGWSTANHVLERIEHAHPIVGLVMRWRTLKRLRDTWITALAATIDPDGRVRSTFHPARSFTGRLVNSDPDLGRVPGRTPEMARIRRAFRAPPGRVLLSLDYVQLGLYVLAHLTGDPALVEPLRAGADMHVATAAAVLDKPPGAITREDRQIGKVVNFATFAGQGSSALALQLGVTAQEAQRWIERFDQRYSVTRAFQDEQLRLARERGFIVTIASRHWPIGDLESLDPQVRSYAERLARRATHEGSVADVSRRGLLRAEQALRAAGIDAFPLVQVHDEVLFEVAANALAHATDVAAHAMRDAWQLRVPLRVGRKAGPTWADLEPAQ